MLNKEEFDFLGITRFHEAGYKGQGVTICSKEEVLEGVFDDVFGFEFEKQKDDYTNHATQVMDYIRQVAPAATKWAIETTGMTTKNMGKYLLEKSERVEYLRDNPPDILTTSYFKSYDFYEYIQTLYKELYEKGCFMCLAAGNENEDIEKLATIDVTPGIDLWKAIGACNYFPSKDEAGIQFKYAAGEEMDYVSLHRLICSWDKKTHVGTSFSAPLFAAMVALVQCFFIEQTGSKLNQENLNKFIIDHCVDLGEDGRDNKTGYGLFILPDPELIEIDKYTTKPIIKDEVVVEVEEEEKTPEIKDTTIQVLPVIRDDATKRYRYLKEVPEGEFHEVIKFMIENDYINGYTIVEDIEDTEVDLSVDMVRMFVINYRAGLYKAKD